MNANKEKVMLFWSGGKNSAMALHELKQNSTYEVIGLITILDQSNGRVPERGVTDSLLVEQAKLLKLPLQRLFLPSECSNDVYKNQVGTLLKMYAKFGIKTFAFGDIHLADVQANKSAMILALGLYPLFPLWGKTTLEVTEKFFETNHKAMVTAVYKDKLGPEFLACEYTRAYIARLPEGIDMAGENGEFHTFVTFGPAFKIRLPFSKSMAVDEGPYFVSLLKEL